MMAGNAFEPAALKIEHVEALPFDISLREPFRIASIIQCMMGCMLESRLGISAAAHFALAHEAVSFFDLDSYFEHLTDPITGGARVVEGMVEVPESPGIGARPDPEFLARAGRE